MAGGILEEMKKAEVVLKPERRLEGLPFQEVAGMVERPAVTCLQVVAYLVACQTREEEDWKKVRSVHLEKKE